MIQVEPINIHLIYCIHLNLLLSLKIIALTYEKAYHDIFYTFKQP